MIFSDSLIYGIGVIFFHRGGGRLSSNFTKMLVSRGVLVRLTRNLLQMKASNPQNPFWRKIKFSELFWFSVQFRTFTKFSKNGDQKWSKMIKNLEISSKFFKNQPLRYHMVELGCVRSFTIQVVLAQTSFTCFQVRKAWFFCFFERKWSQKDIKTFK